MYQLYAQQQELSLGWEFYVPLIGMVILILLAVSDLDGHRPGLAGNALHHRCAAADTAR